MAAWQEASVRCLKAAWKPVLVAIQRDFECFEDVGAVDKDIVSL